MCSYSCYLFRFVFRRMGIRIASITGGWQSKWSNKWQIHTSHICNEHSSDAGKFHQFVWASAFDTARGVFVSIQSTRSSRSERWLCAERILCTYPVVDFYGYLYQQHVSQFQKSIMEKMYAKCAVSVLGGSKILLLNGGAGTGKTAFIRHLLGRFASENFQITSSILVCSRNNTLVDEMAAKVMSSTKIKNIGKQKLWHGSNVTMKNGNCF